jgi:uncharacterized membrane protein
MDAVALIKLALRVLTERLISILSLIMSFVLAIWVMLGKDWVQVLALTIFVVFSHLMTKRDDHERAREASQSE